MAMIAHWKLDDGPWQEPVIAGDSAPDGVDHKGVYAHPNNDKGGLRPFGFEGRSMEVIADHGGFVHTFDNEADLRLDGAMAICGWFFVYEADPSFVIATCGEDGGGGTSTNMLWWLGRISGNQLEFGWHDISSAPVTVQSGPNTLPETGEWVWVAAVREVDASLRTVTLYVNGVAVANATGKNPPPTGQLSTVIIGRWPGAVQTTSGRINSVRFWNDVPQATDLTTIYNLERAYFEAFPGQKYPNIGQIVTHAGLKGKLYQTSMFGSRGSGTQSGFHR